ncbi:MAG: hypothetical protein PHP50_06185 [Lachnospiraceae bacterium]|nr:hypothetical protein [Lachnospiraceae bacterium]
MSIALRYYASKNWNTILRCHTSWKEKRVAVCLIPPVYKGLHKIPGLLVLNGEQLFSVDDKAAYLVTEWMKQSALYDANSVLHDELSWEIFWNKEKSALSAISLETYLSWQVAPVRMLLDLSAQEAGYGPLNGPEAGLTNGQWKQLMDRLKWSGVTGLDLYAGNHPRKDLKNLETYADAFAVRVIYDKEDVIVPLNKEGKAVTEPVVRRFAVDPKGNMYTECFSTDGLRLEENAKNKYLGNLLEMEDFSEAWNEPDCVEYREALWTDYAENRKYKG